MHMVTGASGVAAGSGSKMRVGLDASTVKSFGGSRPARPSDKIYAATKKRLRAEG